MSDERPFDYPGSLQGDVPLASTFCETYQGLPIYHTTGDGYHSANGGDLLGYCDTLEEMRADIDDYWAGTEHGPANGIFD